MDTKSKLKSIGGIKENPLCANEEVSPDSLKDLERIINLKFPNSFRDFHTLYRAFSFISRVGSPCIEKPPVANKDGLVTVDYFYSSAPHSKCSIVGLLSTYEDQIPSGYIPICDGESGDLICLNLNEDEYGSIFYWWHEGNAGEDLFRVNNSFEDFLLRLKIKESVSPDAESRDVKITMTPKFMEMLRKSGIEPPTSSE